MAKEERKEIAVREYSEGFPVYIARDENTGRLIVQASNQGGGGADLDAEDLLRALLELRPHPDVVLPEGMKVETKEVRPGADVDWLEQLKL